MKRIRNICKGVTAFLLAFICAVWANGITGQAQGAGGMTVSIPVNQEIRSSDGESAGTEILVSYCFSAVEAGNPMPDGSEDGSYRFSLTGNQQFDLVIPGFNSAGVYQYKLYAEETDAGETVMVDETEYLVSVYVTNAAGGSLTAEVTAANEAGEKEAALNYSHIINVSEKPQDPDEKPQNPDGGEELPSSGDSQQPGNGGTQPGDNDGRIESGSKGQVQTGDNTMISFWILLAGVSALVLVTLIGRMHRKEKDTIE